MSDSLAKCFSPVTLAGLELRNRVIKAATFEGMCPDGVPSERLFAHHREVAEGGVAMTTLAYCAVSTKRARSSPVRWGTAAISRRTPISVASAPWVRHACSTWAVSPSVSLSLER